MPGHQWAVWLGRRDVDSVDHFPLGENGAEFVFVQPPADARRLLDRVPHPPADAA